MTVDVGFDLAARRARVKDSLRPYAKLVGPGGTYHAWANSRYRAERVRFEALFGAGHDPAADLCPGLAALWRRSEHLAPVVAELSSFERNGRLGVPVATLARSYLLGRIYQSQAARAGT